MVHKNDFEVQTARKGLRKQFPKCSFTCLIPTRQWPWFSAISAQREENYENQNGSLLPCVLLKPSEQSHGFLFSFWSGSQEHSVKYSSVCPTSTPAWAEWDGAGGSTKMTGWHSPLKNPAQKWRAGTSALSLEEYRQRGTQRTVARLPSPKTAWRGSFSKLRSNLTQRTKDYLKLKTKHSCVIISQPLLASLFEWC